MEKGEIQIPPPLYQLKPTYFVFPNLFSFLKHAKTVLLLDLDQVKKDFKFHVDRKRYLTHHFEFKTVRYKFLKHGFEFKTVLQKFLEYGFEFKMVWQKFLEHGFEFKTVQ